MYGCDWYKYYVNVRFFCLDISVCTCVEKLKGTKPQSIRLPANSRCVSVCVRQFGIPSNVQNMHERQVSQFHYSNECIFFFFFFFLLAVCSPVSAVVSICTLQNVWGCAHAWVSKLFSWEAEGKMKKAFKGADYIDNHTTWPAPNIRFIFARNKIKMRKRSWKPTGTWLNCPIRFPKMFDLSMSHYFCFRKKWTLNRILKFFSVPRGHRRPF